MLLKDADGIATSVDPDQTAPLSLIWVCNVCPGLSVRKLRIITVQHSQLTINLVGEQFPIDHPVGIEEHAADKEPGEFLFLKVDGLSDDTKTHQDNKDYYHKVGHVSQLKKKNGSSYTMKLFQTSTYFASFSNSL